MRGRVQPPNALDPARPAPLVSLLAPRHDLGWASAVCRRPPGGAGPGAVRRTDLARAALPAARHRPATPTRRPGLAMGSAGPGRLPVAIPSLPEPSAAPSSAHDPGAPNRARALKRCRTKTLGGCGQVVDLDQDLDIDPYLEVDGNVEVDPLVDLDLGPRSGESSTTIPRTTREVDVQGRRWGRRLRCRLRQGLPSRSTSTSRSSETVPAFVLHIFSARGRR